MLTRQWSSSEIVDSFGTCQNVKEVISAVEKLMWSEGQVVCEVHVNGLRLAEQDEERSVQQSVSDIKSMSVRTESPKALLISTLTDLVTMLPSFRDKCCSAADRFRFQDANSAQETFSEVIEICRYITDVLFVVKNQFPQYFDLNVETAYRNVIGEVLKAFEKMDFALLADILEYDLTNVLVQFQDQLTNLKQHVTIDE